MSYLRRFGRFWWEFVVGDNLSLALGAGLAIAVTAWLVDEGVNAWWLLPVAILGLLAGSVLVAARSARPRERDPGRRGRLTRARSESGRRPA